MDIETEAKFDGDAGGEGEGARKAVEKLWHQCTNTEEMKDGGHKSAKRCRKMDELKADGTTPPGNQESRKQTDTCEVAAALESDRQERHMVRRILV